MESLPDATPQPDGGFAPQLDNAAREAERALDEITASLPENLATRVASFRESAREIEQRRARTSEGGETAVSGFIEWAAEKGRLIAYDDFELLGDPISNETTEHEVWRFGSEGRVLKRSWPGVYGQIPILWKGLIRMKNAIWIVADGSCHAGKVRDKRGSCGEGRPSCITLPAGQAAVPSARGR